MKQRIVLLAWGLSGFTLLLGGLAWYQAAPVAIGQLTVYDIFTLFGISALSLMWSHYVVGAIRAYYDVDQAKLANYFKLTSYAVLIALLLHPGLLIWQLQRDGAGLPFDYVAPDERLYLIFGIVAWLAFMAYEFRRFFADRSWWRYVVIAGDVAMVLALTHGLMLSSQLMPLWFTVTWVLYGVTLLALIFYGRKRRWKVSW